MTAVAINRPTIHNPPVQLTPAQHAFMWEAFRRCPARLAKMISPQVSASLFLHTSRFVFEEKSDGKFSMRLIVQVSGDAEAANGTVTFGLELSADPELFPC